MTSSHDIMTRVTRGNWRRRVWHGGRDDNICTGSPSEGQDHPVTTSPFLILYLLRVPVYNRKNEIDMKFWVLINQKRNRRSEADIATQVMIVAIDVCLLTSHRCFKQKETRRETGGNNIVTRDHPHLPRTLGPGPGPPDQFLCFMRGDFCFLHCQGEINFTLVNGGDY